MSSFCWRSRPWRSARSGAVARIRRTTPTRRPSRSTTGEAPAEELSGDIIIDGSSTVGPLTTAAAASFREEQSGVNIEVGTAGTGGGFERFCAGETDISNASRPIDEEEEVPVCEEAGIEYTEFQVGVDALTVVVNSANDWATCLTVDQLKKIWEPAAEGKVTNWNQVDPSFPDQALSLAGPGTDSGTFDYFTDEINGEEGASRADYTPSEDDNVIVQAVAGDPGGMGYFGYTYYEENQDTLKALEVDGGEGCVAPSVDTARDGSYAPLSRPLFIYVKNESLAQPQVHGFVEYFLTNSIRSRRTRSSSRCPTTRWRRTSRRSRRPEAPNRVATQDTTAGAQPIRLRAEGRRWGEDVVKGLLALCALVSVATTIGIIIALLEPSIEFFREVSIVDFFSGERWAPLFEPASFGVRPLLVGTLAVTFWACVVALPLGLGAAVYLSEYAPPRVRSTLKPALEVLAGIPTVVFGFFALTFFTPLLQDLGVGVGIFNILAAGLVMGVMLIPTVASISEDAMAAVPRELRDGAFGLGASRLQVATRIVIPAAVSGIIASYVLAISRAIGETMIVLIAAGGIAQVTYDPREPAQTMTAFIGATGLGDVPTGSLEYKTIFAVGLTLFVITFAMNIFSIRLVRKFREIYE